MKRQKNLAGEFDAELFLSLASLILDTTCGESPWRIESERASVIRAAYTENMKEDANVFEEG